MIAKELMEKLVIDIVTSFENEEYKDTLKQIGEFNEIVDLFIEAGSSLNEIERQANEARKQSKKNKRTFNNDTEVKARIKAEKAIRAEIEAQIRAEYEAKLKAEAEAKIAAETKARAEHEARIKAEAEAKTEAAAKAKARVEYEARAKAKAGKEAAARLQEAKSIPTIPKLEDENSKKPLFTPVDFKENTEPDAIVIDSPKKMSTRDLAVDKAKDFIERFLK